MSLKVYNNISHVDDKLQEISKERGIRLGKPRLKSFSEILFLRCPSLHDLEVDAGHLAEDNYDPDNKYISKQQVNNLLLDAKICNLRDYVLIRVLWVTGLRVDECLRVRPQDIDRYSIDVINLKHKGARRVVYIDELTKHILEDYIGLNKITPDELIFPLKRTQAHNIIKKYGRMSGLKWIHVHTLRHSFATHADVSGMPYLMIQRILGHNEETYVSTKVYLHNKGDAYEHYLKLDFSE